ncbi:MAG TPA: sigma factor-like helix-turn-helix DNA-binding protein, partial [Actinomycetota bacterium]
MTTVDAGRTFSSFFEEEREPLARVLLLLTGDLDEAEEIQRDAFLTLWARWDRVAPMEDPVAYLYRVALLRERSLLRRAGRRVRSLVGRAPGGGGSTGSEDADRAARALASLAPRARQAVVLTGLLGRSTDEAAAVMGLRPERVRRLAAEGRASVEEGEHDVGAAPLRDRLERIAERATHHEPHVAFERMRAARRRRTRGRRIAAAATVLVLVLGVTGTVVRALDRTRATAGATPRPTPTPAAPAWQEPSTLTVWPESALRGDSADQVQAAADRGAADLAWRTDPGRVAQRFGLIVLGWSNVQLGPPPAPEPDGSEVWRIRPRCDADEEGVTVGDCGFTEVLTVRVVQPARDGEGGIWSVAEVRSADLAIDVDAGAIVPAGIDVAFDLELAADRRAHVGLAATNGCRDVTELEPGQEDGAFELPVPDADDEIVVGCPSVGAGYVFAYAQDEITVPVGDPLLEAATIEFPWLTILPVRLEMQGTAVYPGTLLVDCGAGTETSVPFGVVTAQPDGVHVRVMSSVDAVEV